MFYIFRNNTKQKHKIFFNKVKQEKKLGIKSNQKLEY